MKKFTKVFCLTLVFVMMTGIFGAFSLTGHNVIHADAASGYQVVELPAIGNATSTKRVECAGTYFWVEALKNSANVRYYAVCAAASADAKGVRLFSSWKSDFTDRYPVFTNGTAVIYATPAKDGASVTVSRISVRGNKKSNLRKITADSFRLLSVYGGKVYFEGAKKDAEPNLYTFTIASPKNTKRLNCATYCAKEGECLAMGRDASYMCDGCKSPARICCNYVISAYQRHKDRMKVILVGEELGY